MMKKYIYIISLFFVSTHISAQWKEVPLQTKKSPVRIVSGKKLTYYSAGKDNTWDFTVGEYDTLWLYSRKRLGNDKAGYSVQYIIGDNKTGYTVPETAFDTRAFYTNKYLRMRPSKSFRKKIDNSAHHRKLTVYIPKGKQVDILLTGVKNGKRKRIKPLSAHNTINIITGQKNRYYKLNSNIPARFTIDKPGKLVVYTRARIRKGNNISYSYAYTVAGKRKIIPVKNANTSSKSLYTSTHIKAKPSVYHKIVLDVFDVPATYEFTSSDPVDARFIFKPAKRQIHWNPVRMTAEKVILKVKGKNTQRRYARITPDKPVLFEIQARQPGTLRILSRGEFTYDMFAGNDYILQLFDNDTLIKTFTLSCERSKIMYYKDDKNKIPGTLDKIIFNIPQGRHRYKLSLKNKDKTALVRLHYKI